MELTVRVPESVVELVCDLDRVAVWEVEVEGEEETLRLRVPEMHCETEEPLPSAAGLRAKVGHEEYPGESSVLAVPAVSTKRKPSLEDATRRTWVVSCATQTDERLYAQTHDAP